MFSILLGTTRRHFINICLLKSNHLKKVNLDFCFQMNRLFTVHRLGSGSRVYNLTETVENIAHVRQVGLPYTELFSDAKQN